MAEFSKQWCEKHSELTDSYDFDIFEIFDNLEPGYYSHIICEGYGFFAIGKGEGGECLLAMPTDHPLDETSTIEWKKYEEIVK